MVQGRVHGKSHRPEESAKTRCTFRDVQKKKMNFSDKNNTLS